MIGYGPELQDMVFGTECYTCTDVRGDTQGVRLTLVPNNLNRPAVMDFVHASWQDVMEAAVTLRVDADTICITGDWWPGVEDELTYGLEGVYKVTRLDIRTIKITYKAKGPVLCTINHLTWDNIRKHLTKACNSCSTPEHWEVTLRSTIQQVLVNIDLGNSDLYIVREKRLLRMLCDTFSKALDGASAKDIEDIVWCLISCM